MQAKIRCICGYTFAVNVGEFSQCPQCRAGVSVTITRDILGRERLQPTGYIGTNTLDERRALGIPVLHDAPEIIDWWGE